MGGKILKTYHVSYGTRASVADMKDGRARLIVRDQLNRKVKDSIHKNRKAALAAWYRFCN
jgi:hypothetical protein